MAIAFVQQNQAGVIADGGTVAFGSNVGSDTLLVAQLWVQSTTERVSAISDTLGNTWQRAVESDLANNNARVDIWYALCPTGGACTVTFDYTAAATVVVQMQEYSGFAGGVTVGPTNTNIETFNNTTRIAGEITTTVADSLLIAIIGMESNFSVSSRLSGWNALTATIRSDHQYKIATATETTDAEITCAAVERGAGAIVAFSESAGGGGGGTTLRPKQRRQMMGLG